MESKEVTTCDSQISISNLAVLKKQIWKMLLAASLPTFPSLFKN